MFIFLDTETTDTGPDDRLCQIAFKPKPAPLSVSCSTQEGPSPSMRFPFTISPIRWSLANHGSREARFTSNSASWSRANGFVERFNRTVLDEFFRTTFRKKLYESVEALQKDLDAWLEDYNHKRPRRGYRSQGRRPMETFEQGNAQRENLLRDAA